MESTWVKMLDFIQRVNQKIWEIAPDIIDWLTAELNTTQQQEFGVTYRFELILGSGLIVILGLIIIKWVKDFIV